jgi:hypothetical protein
MQETATVPTADDQQFEDVTVAKVEPSGHQHVAVTWGNGWTLGVPLDRCPVVPTVGEHGRLYGRGIGYPVRGIVIGERVYSYATEAQQRQRAVEERAVADAKKLAELNAQRAERDRRTAALPEPLAKRLRWFQFENG